MNLFLALFWLICAAMLLVYEQTFGPTHFRIRVVRYDFSYAWLMLLLVAYNLHRWWWIRSNRAKQRALAMIALGRHSSTAVKTPDPNFQFTDEPPPPSNHGITDQPPPNL